METNILLYADDTSLLEEISDPLLSFQKINRDLFRLNTWASKWLITFNPLKTEYIVFTKKLTKQNYPKLYLGNSELKEVKTHKQLGVTFNNKMNFNDHVIECIEKAMKRLTTLKCIQHKFPRQSKLQIYISFIRPVLEYGWHLYDSCTQNVLDKLEKVQREAVLIITRAYKRTSKSNLLNEVGLSSLKSRRNLLKGHFIFKYTKGKLPVYINEVMPPFVRDTTRYNLRNANDIVIPRTRKNYMLKSFIPSAIKEWNQLPFDIRHAESLDLFKKKYKLSYLHDYNSMYLYGNDSEAIQLSRIRMGLSALSSQRKHYHLINDGSCTACQYRSESPLHLFLLCPVYAAQRINLFMDLQTGAADIIDPLINYQVNNKAATKLLGCFLFGVNDKEKDRCIFDAVYNYIRESKRFV